MFQWAPLPNSLSTFKQVFVYGNCFNGRLCPTPCQPWGLDVITPSRVSMGAFAQLPVNMETIMSAIQLVSMGAFAQLPVNIWF